MKNYLSSLNFIIISIVLVSFGSCKENQTNEIASIENVEGIPVVTVRGTPYEMGFQLGTVLKSDIQECLPGFLSFAQKHDAERYSNELLDEAWAKMLPYIDIRFIEEMDGLAEGSGIDLDILRRAHMVPVISDYACSGVAVWGDATISGDLFHIRNLDYIKEAHLQDYPAIVIYIPNNGTPHINVTFAGYIASHSGMNANGIVLGEKGESPNSDTPFNYDGIHFSLLFRELLYETTNLDETVDRIQKAKLIKRYYLFASDGKKESIGAAKFLVSSPDEVKIRTWKENDPTDTLIPSCLPNTIYYTIDNKNAYSHLTNNAGKYNAEKMIELSKLVANKGGNLLNVVYNPSELEIWVAYAKGSEDAFEQDYINIKMKEFISK